jgi:hypothetical protein
MPTCTMSITNTSTHPAIRPASLTVIRTGTRGSCIRTRTILTCTTVIATTNLAGDLMLDQRAALNRLYNPARRVRCSILFRRVPCERGS